MLQDKKIIKAMIAIWLVLAIGGLALSQFRKFQFERSIQAQREEIQELKNRTDMIKQGLMNCGN
jgi:cell division protein FtsL